MPAGYLFQEHGKRDFFIKKLWSRGSVEAIDLFLNLDSVETGEDFFFLSLEFSW